MPEQRPALALRTPRSRALSPAPSPRSPPPALSSVAWHGICSQAGHGLSTVSAAALARHPTTFSFHSFIRPNLNRHNQVGSRCGANPGCCAANGRGLSKGGAQAGNQPACCDAETGLPLVGLLRQASTGPARALGAGLGLWCGTVFSRVGVCRPHAIESGVGHLLAPCCRGAGLAFHKAGVPATRVSAAAFASGLLC